MNSLYRVLVVSGGARVNAREHNADTDVRFLKKAFLVWPRANVKIQYHHHNMKETPTNANTK